MYTVSDAITRMYEYDGPSEDGKGHVFYNEKDEEDSIIVPLKNLGDLASYLVGERNVVLIWTRAYKVRMQSFTNLHFLL
jgi:hypothetical protein